MTAANAECHAACERNRSQRTGKSRTVGGEVGPVQSVDHVDHRHGSPCSPQHRCRPRGVTMTQWKIGDVTIRKVVELKRRAGSNFCLPQATQEVVLLIQWLRRISLTTRGRLEASVQPRGRRRGGASSSTRASATTSAAISKPGTCARGRSWVSSPRPASARRDRPRALHASTCRPRRLEHAPRRRRGYRPSPTRAIYSARGVRALASATRPHARIMQDSVQPVIDAGLVDLVATDHLVAEGSGSRRRPATRRATSACTSSRAASAR